MDFEDLLIWRMLIAVPELEFDEVFAKILLKHGVVRWHNLQLGQRTLKQIEDAAALRGRMRNKTLIQRIMMVMPEVMSVEVVDLLRGWGLINIEVAHGLRIALRAAGNISPIFVSSSTLGRRATALFRSLFNEEVIDLLRDLDQARINRFEAILKSREDEKSAWLRRFMQLEEERLKLFNFDRNTLSPKDREYLNRVYKSTREEILAMTRFRLNTIKIARELSVSRAEAARFVLGVSNTAFRTIASITRLTAEVKAAENAWDAIALVYSKGISDIVLKNALRFGLISTSRYDLIRSIEVVGLDIWKKVGISFSKESWMARALLISEGVISHEMLTALYRAKLINDAAYTVMYPSVTAIRNLTRSYGNRFRKSERMRLIPRENPLGTFVRRTEGVDRALIRILAEAADDARKAAEKLELAGKIGKSARAAQQRVVIKELNDAILRTYENVGYMTVFGEKKAALAAAEAMDALTEKVWGSTPKMQDLRREFTRSARSGIEAYVSRQENLVPLADRLYSGGIYSRSLVNREISKALLRGLSAEEFAKNVERLFKNNVPGGVSYAAMRLARTEINNAFHFTQIRYTREMPWVTGYRWNRSGRANSRPHACSDYANNDGFNMGPGVFPKSEVPGKPHPQCLCFLTTTTMTNGNFEKRMRSGAFDRYFKEVQDSGYFEDAWTVDRRNLVLEYLPGVARVAISAATGEVGAIVRGALRKK